MNAMQQLTPMQRQAVEELVEYLFTTGGGQVAERLVLWQDSTQRSLGGWARAPVAERIAETVLKLTDVASVRQGQAVGRG